MKLTLMTNDSKVNELGIVNIAHMTNFSSNECTFHCHLQDELIKFTTLLVVNMIPFSVRFNSVVIDLTRVSIRLDS